MDNIPKTNQREIKTLNINRKGVYETKHASHTWKLIGQSQN